MKEARESGPSSNHTSFQVLDLETPPYESKMDLNHSQLPFNAEERHALVQNDYQDRERKNTRQTIEKISSQFSASELGHIQGAMQRKKLFTNHLSKETSDLIRHEDDFVEPINSPSIESFNKLDFKKVPNGQTETFLENNKQSFTEMRKELFQLDASPSPHLEIQGHHITRQSSNSLRGGSIPVYSVQNSLSSGVEGLLNRETNEKRYSSIQMDVSVKLSNARGDGMRQQDERFANLFAKLDDKVVMRTSPEGKHNQLQAHSVASYCGGSENGLILPSQQNANMSMGQSQVGVETQYEIKRDGTNLLDVPSNAILAGSSILRKNSDKSQISQRTQQLQSQNPSGQPNKLKKRNFLKAFYFTYKFLQKMRFVRKYKNIYMLEKKHFKLIKDYAFGGLYERGSHRNICTNLMGNISYLLFDIKSPLQTFHPNSIMLLIYEFSLLLLLCLLTFYIPMKVCFSFAYDFSEPEWITLLLDIVPYILISEMFININTAYFREGATVMDRKQIIKRYFSFKFWMDILTLLSLQQNNILQIIFILRIYQIFKIINDFDDNFQIQFKYPTVFELCRLLLIIVLVAHICGCGFHLILNYQSDTTASWLSKSNVKDGTWMEKYVAALYFSFTTMITVGFGDICPESTGERIYVIVIQLVSCGVFAYAINTIGSIFQDIARRSSEYKQKKQELMDYMGRRKISKQTQIKILKYLEYIHSSGEEGHQKGYNILGSLSKRLRDIVYKEYYGRILMQFKLFNRSFSEKFLKTLSLYMHEVTLGPGEILYNQGEIDQRFFFVQSGAIQQFVDLQDNGHKDIILATMRQGEYFGLHGFLAKIDCKSSARSLNVSQLVTCNLDDFIQVIKQFPNDYEVFCSLKDSISLCDNKVDVMCSSCGRYSHQVQNCPLLHYEIDKEAHIRRWIHNDPQQRDEKFTRVKPNFLKWSSRNQPQTVSNHFTLDPITTSPLKRNKDFIHQRFNVFKEFYELRMNLRHMRVKLRGPDDYDVGSDDEDLIYNEDDDRQFILKTDVPFYQTMYMYRAKQQLRGIFANDEYQTEEDDMYEEEFADYEELMYNADDREENLPGSSPLVGAAQQSMQRMSTLSSQVHVPTEKSAFIKMPTTNSFHPSGKNRKRKNRKQSSDYEDDDDDDEDFDEENDDDNEDDDDQNQDEEYDNVITDSYNDISGILDSTKGKKQQKLLKKKNIPRVLPKGKQNHIVSFKEENNGSSGRKGSTLSKVSKGDMNTQNTNEDECATPKQKSIFFRVAENPIPSQSNIHQSPLRYQNRHKSANPISSFNNGFETYLRSSNLDTPSSSMNSIVLQHQGSKRKGTIQSSIGQGSSKLKNSGSQDFSINIQRTGTLNSRGIIRNSNPVLSSKKISDPKTPISRTNTLKSLKQDFREQTRVGPSSSQYVRHQNTQADNLSEKQIAKVNNNVPGSLKAEIETIYVIMDFEKSCEFTHYSPHNNLQNILKQLKKLLKVKVDYQQKQTLKTIKTARTMKPMNSQANSHSKRDQLSNYHRPSAVTQNNNTLGQISMGMSIQGITGLGSGQGAHLMNAVITGAHDTYSPDSINSKSAEKIITLSFQQ